VTARPAGRGLAIGGLTLLLLACASAPDADRAGAAVAHDREIASRPGPETEVQPDALLGLSADRLTALIGPPDFTRNDGPAEIWQFRNSQCILDVFLYRELSGGGYRVEHVESRDRQLVGAADRACVADLLRARRTRPAG
jgi:hypothetical protein